MTHYAKRFFGQQGIIKDGLKLWLDASNPASYPGSGTVWNDLSGNGNNGTLINGVAYSGANGGVMSFDGVNDKVTGSILVPSRTFSVSFWIKSSGNLNYNQGIWVGTGYWGGFTIHAGSGGLAWVGITTANRISSIPNVYDLNWNNLVFTFDNGTAKLYKNNSLLTSATLTNPTDTNLLNYSLESLFGLCNDFIIYSRALTPAEISQNFEVTRYKYGI